MNLEGLMQYMNMGGAFVIWALLGCSIVVVAICFERIYVLAKAQVNGEWLLKQVAIFISRDRLADAIEFCRNRKWLLARIFQSGLYRAQLTRDDMLQSMDSALSGANRTLESNLSILGTIAVIAPFIGLLGTVLGIIQAFDEIAKHGKTGIETVGAGVAEALVTTAGGLFVAILAVVAFNMFKSKIKRMVGEMTDLAGRLGEILALKQSGVLLPADLDVEIPEKKTETEKSPRKNS